MRTNHLSSLILKRAPIGWNQDTLLADGAVIGRTMNLAAVPENAPWV
jgi:hypothetical protein